MTRHKGTKTSFGGTYIAPRAKAKTATGTNFALREQSHTDYVGNIVHPAVSPYFYFSHQLNNKWTAGISMNTPYGMITSYDSDWAGRFHGTKSDIKTLTLTPMLAYKANDKLSFGAGFQMQYVKAKLSNAQALPTGISAKPYIEDAVKLKGDAFDIGYTLGALYEYSDKTRFGVGYRSQIKHKLKGDIKFDLASQMNQDITARLTTPASLTFGAYHDINDQWSVMAEIGRVYWSSFEELRIRGNSIDSITEEKWKDTTSYAVGASYRVNDQWKLRAGFAIDSGAVDDEYRTPRIPEADRYWYSGGVEYGFNEKTTLNVGYTYIRAEKGKVNLRGDHNGDLARGSVKAKYENDVHILAVGLNYNF